MTSLAFVPYLPTGYPGAASPGHGTGAPSPSPARSRGPSRWSRCPDRGGSAARGPLAGGPAAVAAPRSARGPRRRSCRPGRHHRNRPGAPRAAGATMTPRCSARSAPPTPVGRRAGAPSPTMSTPGQRPRRPGPRLAGGHQRQRSPLSGRNPCWPGRTPRTPLARAPYPANAPASRSIYRQAQLPGHIAAAGPTGGGYH